MWSKKAEIVSQKRSGQTTMIFILLIIVIFAGMGIFLLSLAKTVSQSEYMNIYAHNLLSSIMKTDTGFTSPTCKTVSDLLGCSFLSPTYVCDGDQDCFTLANQKVNNYISRFALIKEGFRYLLTVEPEGFVSLPQGGQPYTVEIGDSSLKEEKTEKITANQKIQKILGGNPYILNIRFTIAKKQT